jgi:hypothetical protein
MILDADQPIRLDRLAYAVTHFVELQYIRLPAEGSFFDAEWDEPRDDAVADFRSYLDHDEDDNVREVQRALCWVLNLPPARFAEVSRDLHIPYPRFEPVEVRRFLELLWARSFDGDWHVDDFDADAYTVTTRA